MDLVLCVRNVERTPLAISGMTLGSVSSRAGIAAILSIMLWKFGNRVELVQNFQELLSTVNRGAERLLYIGAKGLNELGLGLSGATTNLGTTNLCLADTDI